MSDHGIRRPRRIVRQALAGDAPFQTLPRKRFALAVGWRNADRATDADRGTPSVKTDSSPLPITATVMRARQVERPLPTDAAASDSSPETWRFSGPRDARDDVHTLTPQGWEQPLVDMVVGMYGAEEAIFEHWSVVIPMDARVLPETELHLSLSGQRLTLRFQTQSVSAQQVLSQYRILLLRLLEVALPKLRDIDIDIA